MAASPAEQDVLPADRVPTAHNALLLIIIIGSQRREIVWSNAHKKLCWFLQPADHALMRIACIAQHSPIVLNALQIFIWLKQWDVFLYVRMDFMQLSLMELVNVNLVIVPVRRANRLLLDVHHVLKV